MKLKNKLSRYSLIVCVVLISLFTLQKKQWTRENGVIVSDVINYYGYLPATFIFHDLGIKKAETIDNGTFWAVHLPNGNNVIKMSMGLSMIYAPFFLWGMVRQSCLVTKLMDFRSPINLHSQLVIFFIY